MTVLTPNQCPLAPVSQAALYFTVAEKHVQEEQARPEKCIDLAALEVNFSWVCSKVGLSGVAIFVAIVYINPGLIGKNKRNGLKYLGHLRFTTAFRGYPKMSSRLIGTLPASKSNISNMAIEIEHFEDVFCDFF